MVQHTYISLQSNQTGNKHVEFSTNVADLFVFSGTNGENPVPESNTKI